MSNSLDGYRITALACFDSFGKMGMTMLAACRKAGADTHMVLLDVQGRTLSRRQRIEVQRIDPRTRITRHPWANRGDLFRKQIQSSDAIILGLDGKRSKDILIFLRTLWAEQARRPILVSAYPGILFRHQVEGMLDRAGVDMLCLNSPVDLEIYNTACQGLSLDSSNAVLTGLPILWDLQPQKQPRKEGSILFFEQPSVPSNPLQRQYICQQLETLAQRWPDRTVIFKPRISSVERTLHRHHGEMARSIKRLSRNTPNLKISMKPACHLLRDCSCAITVSSTAALEAMAMGISTRIVADLGLNETLGNHYFASSGALAEFESICADPFSIKHRLTWLENHGWQTDGKNIFLNKLATALASRAQADFVEKLCTKSWGSPYWQSFALANGGVSMLSSGGMRSTHRKRNRTRSILRQLRDYLIGIGLFEKIVRGR